MRVPCPACGAVFSLDAALNDANARRAFATLGNIPGDVSGQVPQYLGLFRVPGAARGMPWGKAARLCAEIQALVSTGWVGVGNMPARPATPSMWAAGMRQMVEARDALKLPMTSHKYLIKIVWDMANDQDRRHEVRKNKAERDGTLAAANAAGRARADPEPFGGMTPEEMRKIKEENLKKRKAKEQ